MKFLITGAAGFLGSALANHLVVSGHHVRGLDDLSSGDASLLHKQVHFTKGDISDRPKLWTLLQEVDCVYHLAARVFVPQSMLYPREYNDVNVGGTVSLMEAIRDVGVQRVVFVSSGAIYGDQKDHSPFVETDSPQPRSPYAVSKLAAEYYVRTIGELWGIETLSLRVFNAYGEGQPIPPAHPPVVAKFFKQACSSASMIVNGDGSQTRDFVYIDDVVQAMARAAFAENVKHEIVNVGSGEATSMKKLAEQIHGLTRSESEILYTPRNDGGVSYMCADLAHAKKVLNWEPQIHLEEGLKLVLENDERFEMNE